MKKSLDTKELRKLLLPAVVAVIAGVFLRLSALNALPVFADEAIYVRWAQIMRAEPTLRFLPNSDGKQPLYMWAVIPFLKLISDPVIAGRVFSAVVSVATAPLIGGAYYILFKKSRAAVVSSIIWLVLPFSVFFGRMALVDSLLTFFVVATFLLMGIAFEYRRWDFSMLAGFTLGAAWLTKSPALFTLAFLPTLILLPHVAKKPHFRLLQYGGLLLTTYIIAFGMYNIQRLGPQFHMIALRNKDYLYPVSEILAHPLFPFTKNWNDSFQFFLYFLTPVGLLFSVWGLAADWKNHIRQRFILAVWWIVPVVIQSITARNLTARYLLFTAPFAVMLMSHALEHINSRVKNKAFLAVSILLIVIPSLWMNWTAITDPRSVPLPRIERAGYLEEWTAGTGILDVSRQIKLYAQRGPVLVGSEGFFGTPFDGLGAYLNDTPNVRVVGVGVWVDSVNDKLTNSLKDNQVFLVVNSSRFHIAEPEKVGLKLLSSYPKAMQPDGEQEYLLFFQVMPEAKR